MPLLPSSYECVESTTLKTLFAVIAFGVVILVALAGYGNARWNAGTTQLLNRLDAAQVKTAPQFYNAQELLGLPDPVKRYFETVLKDGQPIITAATVQHSGTFNMGEIKDDWKPFTSTQRVVTKRPGFDWDARVTLFPGVAAYIHDAYISGSGLLKVAIFGLIPVADLPATADLSRGELLRYLAEAAWYPTALLPSQGVVWKSIDAQSAIATLTDGDITLSMRFGFGANGLIDTGRAESRGRLVGSTMGRFWNYTQKSGMLVPLEAEVAWVLPEGPRPYYRSLMSAVNYDYASPANNSPTP